jgi:precorrin-2/cobalt-factor-2 C20-methyltransferase
LPTSPGRPATGLWIVPKGIKLMQNQTGILYGIGVGPGDPELLTLKAVRVLSMVDVVFTAASSKNAYSLAVNIARPHIPAATPVRHLAFPMTRDRRQTRAAWKANAREIGAVLETGQSAAFLTLGDPMTFSTFGYILKWIRRLFPAAAVETVPGITSYQASAAALNRPLVEGEQSLLILSGANGGRRLMERPVAPDTVVFMKAYRNINDICQVLEKADMLTHSAGVVACGLPDQEIVHDIQTLQTRAPNYWTLIIAKKSTDDDPQTE